MDNSNKKETLKKFPENVLMQFDNFRKDWFMS